MARYAAVILLFFAAVAAAQPFVDRLPANTAIYVGWSPSAAVRETKPARMLADDAFMRPLRAIVEPWLLSAFGDRLAEKLPDEFPLLLGDAMRCEGCFAVTELKSTRAFVRCQAALIVNLGSKRAEFEAHFKPQHERLKSLLGEKVQLMRMGESWLWVQPDRDNKPQFVWGFLGERFVMLWGNASESLLANLQKPPEKSLKTSPDFVDAQQHLAGDAVIFSYVDGRAASDLARYFTGSQLGFGGLKYLAESTRVADGQFLSRTLLRTDAAPFASLGEQPVDDAMLKMIPPQPMVAAAFRLEMTPIYEQLARRFKDLDAAGNRFGLPIKDLVAALGDQWVIYNSSATGGFALTGWTIVAAIRDREKIQQTVESVRRMISHETRIGIIEEKNFDGVTIQFLRPMHGGFDFSLIAPAWAMLGDKLIVAAYPQLVEDAIRQSKSASSLLDDPAYHAAKERAGNGGAMLYVSGSQATRNVYPVLLTALTAVQGFANSPSVSEIPSMQHILDYAGDDLASAKAQADGMLINRTSENPLFSPLSALSPTVCVAAALPELIWFSADHERDLTQKNLRAIGKALSRYSNEHHEFPANLQALVDADLIDAAALVSPIATAPSNADYIYLGRPDPHLNKNTILVYDAAEQREGGGVSVLYTNIQIDFLEKPVFDKVLREAKIPAEAK